MGNPLGSMATPPPVAGKTNQQSWMSGIFGQLYGSNGQLQGVPAYTGQLTPDVNNTILPSVWNSWSALNSQLSGANPTSGLEAYASGGGGGSATSQSPQQMPAQASNPWSHSMMPWGGGGGGYQMPQATSSRGGMQQPAQGAQAWGRQMPSSGQQMPWMNQMMQPPGSPPPQAAANLASMGRQF
jgi:hypothetical protein